MYSAFQLIPWGTQIQFFYSSSYNDHARVHGNIFRWSSPLYVPLFLLSPSTFGRFFPNPWTLLLLPSFSLSRRGWSELLSKWRHNFAWSNFQCNPHLVYHFDGLMGKAIAVYDALFCLWAALAKGSLAKHYLAWGSAVHFIAGGSS